MRFILSLALLSCTTVLAADYMPANLRWSLNNDPHRTFDSLNVAIEQNCAQLRSHPPIVNNVPTNVVSCGQIGSSSSITKRINVSYTLRLASSSLQADKQIKSNFTLTHQASCMAPGFAHLQEEPTAAFRYSCWRCPQSERRSKQPKFIADGSVRWFSSAQCPVDIAEKRPARNNAINPEPVYIPKAMPPVLGLRYEDSVALHVEKQAQYGWVVALVFNDGQRRLFIGDREGNRLSAAQTAMGTLQRKAQQWQWSTHAGTRYVFEARDDDYLQVESKLTPDGQSWQFHWLRLPLIDERGGEPEIAARLEWAIDQQKQRYTFYYDEKGEISRVTVEGRELYATPSLTLFNKPLFNKPLLRFNDFSWFKS